MISPIFTTEAISTGGGRDGHIRTQTGSVDSDMRIPRELGGPGGGVNPEELFAAGYAACFHSALHGAARGKKITLIDSSVGARVSLVRGENDGIDLAVDLEIVLPGLDPELAQEVAEIAHAGCPYSRATRGNITVNLVVSED